MKGSYYANPQIDHPDVPDRLRASHPEYASPHHFNTNPKLPVAEAETRYYSGNVWPDNISGMEEFESTFKAFVPALLDTYHWGLMGIG